jgi:hypothetical protein
MSEESLYRVGDEVWFEECWEDESGYYHDECARIVDIDENGILTLDWYLEHIPEEYRESVQDFLNGFTFSLNDIAYKN